MTKHGLATIGTVVLLAPSGGGAFAKGNGNAGFDAPPTVHHSADAPMPAPISGAGVPHGYSGQHLSAGQHMQPSSGSYRPVTANVNGHKVLVYPSVTSTNVRHSLKSTGNNAVHPTAGSQHSANLQHKSAGMITAKPRKLDPQTAARLRNWSGNRSTTAQAHQINANNSHHHHDHDWWHHHCVAFIFWNWGWWAWDDGWWYPAWGYDPYSNYDYNQPIYGDFTPEQIVAGVQTELQRRGYYTYAIDGEMGPRTRSALNRFQTDHHMNITSGIDPATLNALGLVH
jgi:hypothetical protein